MRGHCHNLWCIGASRAILLHGLAAPVPKTNLCTRSRTRDYNPRAPFSSSVVRSARMIPVAKLELIGDMIDMGVARTEAAHDGRPPVRGEALLQSVARPADSGRPPAEAGRRGGGLCLHSTALPPVLQPHRSPFD